MKQLGACIPNPRKLKEASKMMVVATLKVEITIKEEIILGNICLKHNRFAFFVPMDFDGLYKLSLSLILSTSPLTNPCICNQTSW